MPISRSHEEAVIELLKNDIEFTATYLDNVLSDGDQEELMTALRRVAIAKGGVQQIANNASLNPTTIYKTLSPKGNPELKSFVSILNAMGLRIGIVPVKHAAT